MREVIPQHLWIGTTRDAHDVSAILDAGIGAVVDLAMECTPLTLPRDVTYVRFPLVDGAGNPPELIRAAVSLVATLIESRLPVLVSCGAGMSRAPAIVAAARAQLEATTLEESLERITQGAAHDISSSFWMEVKRACEKLT